MHQYKPLNEESSHLDIAHIRLDSIKDCSKSGSNVSQALILTVKLVLFCVRDYDFDLISDLSVSEIPFHESVVNLGICNFDQGFEHHVAWNQEFLLVVDKFKHAISVCQVMHRHGLGKHVVPYTSHLHGICRE
jgi:hypothetical protein